MHAHQRIPQYAFSFLTLFFSFFFKGIISKRIEIIFYYQMYMNGSKEDHKSMHLAKYVVKLIIQLTIDIHDLLVSMHCSCKEKPLNTYELKCHSLFPHFKIGKIFSYLVWKLNIPCTAFSLTLNIKLGERFIELMCKQKYYLDHIPFSQVEVFKLVVVLPNVIFKKLNSIIFPLFSTCKNIQSNHSTRIENLL